MNARTLTCTATLAAMALTVALTASSVAAAPRAGAAERAKKSVACRTVDSYTMSAWLVPTAMVLHSAKAWTEWNDQMAKDGLAVGAEPLPKDVDWAKESVLVLALGELSVPHHVELLSARRTLSGVVVSVHVEPGYGGSSPALVMAMDKSAAARLQPLSCDYSLSLPECRTYPEAALAGSADTQPVALAVSWGAMKAEYR